LLKPPTSYPLKSHDYHPLLRPLVDNLFSLLAMPKGNPEDMIDSFMRNGKILMFNRNIPCYPLVVKRQTWLAGHVQGSQWCLLPNFWSQFQAFGIVVTPQAISHTEWVALRPLQNGFL